MSGKSYITNNIRMMEKGNNFIFGIHPVMEALESRRKIEKVLFRQGIEGPQFRSLMERLKILGIQFQFVPIGKLNVYTKSNHQGVVALLPAVDYISMEEIKLLF